MRVTINTYRVAKADLIKQLDWSYENLFDGAELSCSPCSQQARGLWHWDRKFDLADVHALRNGVWFGLV